jgi:hypothetical protein
VALDSIQTFAKTAISQIAATAASWGLVEGTRRFRRRPVCPPSHGASEHPNRSSALPAAQQMLGICPFSASRRGGDHLRVSGATIARSYSSANRPSMTFKSERRLEGRTLVLKLSGRVQAEHLEQLSRELPTDGTPAVLDLTDVTLVDVAVVRFLAASEARGVRLFGLSRFVREWITREEKPSVRSRKRKKRKK